MSVKGFFIHYALSLYEYNNPEYTQLHKAIIFLYSVYILQIFLIVRCSDFERAAEQAAAE